MKSFLKIVSAAALVGLGATSAMAQNSGATTSSIATGKVITPLTIAPGTNVLAFGTVVKPATGSYSVVVTSAGARGGDANSYLQSTTPHAADFTITGEPGELTTVALGIGGNGHITMTGPSGANNTIDVTLLPSIAALSSYTLASGNNDFTVGGSFSLPSTQLSGNYTGTLTAVVTYN